MAPEHEGMNHGHAFMVMLGLDVPTIWLNHVLIPDRSQGTHLTDSGAAYRSARTTRREISSPFKRFRRNWH